MNPQLWHKVAALSGNSPLPSGICLFLLLLFVFWENPVVWFFRSCSPWVRDIWCPWLQTRKPNLQRGLPIWILSYFIVDLIFNLLFPLFMLLIFLSFFVFELWMLGRFGKQLLFTIWSTLLLWLLPLLPNTPTL